MKRFKFSVSFMMVLALVLVFIGCSKPPEAEPKAAQAAMDAAVSAGADKYAAADLDAAKKVWEAAEAQVKEKKYKEAKQGYMDAKAAFEKAAGAVEAGKKAVADEATAALAAVEEAWKGVDAAAKKVADDFFGRFAAEVADAGAPPPATAPAPQDTPTQQGTSRLWWIAVAAAVAVCAWLLVTR